MHAFDQGSSSGVTQRRTSIRRNLPEGSACLFCHIIPDQNEKCCIPLRDAIIRPVASRGGAGTATAFISSAWLVTSSRV
ncbi:hypothetical protein KOW79_007775 [Hemibagrus wyckioides]|uniref:Uncharacterized protein n=1 Tax=Hemibagrus wyckioides TaxID=337641 RepID=A0A9D3SLY1_9TELE|nr:hypothetical protein KOW79_007775 [Hemibagrus wyckioides]